MVAEFRARQVVGLNGGATTTHIAHHLAQTRITVTVVTNAVNIAFELTGSGISVVLVGGVLRPTHYETTGPIALEGLANLRLDWAVLAAKGVDQRFGASTDAEAEASVGRALSRQADRVVLAVDHRQLERTKLFRMVGWDRIYAVTCDRAGATTLLRWGLVPPPDVSQEAGSWRVHRLVRDRPMAK